jgi:hypothetical protein
MHVSAEIPRQQSGIVEHELQNGIIDAIEADFVAKAVAADPDDAYMAVADSDSDNADSD